MANPVNAIITSGIGRGSQLEMGVGNNQYVRASDFNPVANYINQHDGVAMATDTAGNTPTINSYVGRVTTATLTTAGAYATTTVTISNSLVTAASVVTVQLESYAGTLVTNGIPMIFRAVASAGAITVVIINMHPTVGNALNAAVVFNFTVA